MRLVSSQGLMLLPLYIPLLLRVEMSSDYFHNIFIWKNILLYALNDHKCMKLKI